jgi:hypothetical protein
MKIVINTCFGGFDLSDEAIQLYAKLAGINLVEGPKQYGITHFYVDSVSEENYFSYYKIARDDGFLIETVETLGEAANGDCAALKVVEIPDDVDWEIDEYDGNEHVAEKHRTWG